MNNCIFCQIIAGEVPCTKVFENETTLAFLDIFPATPYHTLVIPKNHFESIFDAPAPELQAIMETIKRVTSLYEEKLGLQNVQIVNSSGKEAQQDVFHLHFHIVPRQTGDGQDIHWEKHPEYREHFEEQLGKLFN